MSNLEEGHLWKRSGARSSEITRTSIHEASRFVCLLTNVSDNNLVAACTVRCSVQETTEKGALLDAPPFPQSPSSGDADKGKSGRVHEISCSERSLDSRMSVVGCHQGLASAKPEKCCDWRGKSCCRMDWLDR